MRKWPTLEELEALYKGKKFNHLLILDLYKEPRYGWFYTYAHCLCDCGRIHDTALTNIIHGTTKSCGCIKKIATAQNIRKAIAANTDYHRVANEVLMMTPQITVVKPTGSNFDEVAFYVDTTTWLWLNRWPWSVDSTGYMSTSIGGMNVRYHSLILCSPPNYVIDHKNRYQWDNTYSNLRVITQAYNNRNRGAAITSKSGCKGIIQTGPSTWAVQIMLPNSGGKRRSKITHSLQEAISIQKQWEDELIRFEEVELDTPKLVLPDGRINPYFRFDWYHPRYNIVWEKLGIRLAPPLP